MEIVSQNIWNLGDGTLEKIMLKRDVAMEYMPRTILPADKLTKLSEKTGHCNFTKDIMGLQLLQEAEIDRAISIM
jgi:hypothetical protein